MNIRCLKCKGADLACGRSFCPIIAKSQAQFRIREKLVKEDFFGASPAPFVGRFGYPYVNVGILSPVDTTEGAWEYDAPRHWADHDYKIPRIIDFRSALVNSRFRSYVKQKSTKLMEISQEVGMSSKPVEVEINLKQKPKFRLNTDSYVAPMGPNAAIEKAKITSNPKVHSKVDKVVSDTSLKANPALVYLYEHGFDENFLSKLLSVGNLGVRTGRKLVPTRWSITAVDDALANHALDELRQYPESDYCAYFGNYLGNHYLVLLFPDVWSYELFETFMPKASWNPTEETQFMTDYEPYTGRKTYAENCGGGYYAARLPIVEKLKKLKRQASILCLRFITGEYAVPLGVWVVREATRKAMQSKPLHFADKELMIKYAKSLVKKKFGFNLDNLLRHSILLKEIKEQKKLTSFVS